MNALAMLQTRERSEEQHRRRQKKTRTPRDPKKRRKQLDHCMAKEDPWDILKREFREDVADIARGHDTRVYPQNWMLRRRLEEDRAAIANPENRDMWSVVKVVCDVFCIQPEDLWAVSHQRASARRRAVVADLILRLIPSASYPKIGKILKRDHTTVMNAVKQLPGYLDLDPEFARQYEVCCQHFGIKP